MLSQTCRARRFRSGGDKLYGYENPGNKKYGADEGGEEEQGRGLPLKNQNNILVMECVGK